MPGKPKEGASASEEAHLRYQELVQERGWMGKSEAARIIAAETGKRVHTVERYLAYFKDQPRVTGPGGPESGDEIWARARDLGERAAKRAQTAGRATIEVFEDKPFGILASSDEHLDSVGSALERVESVADTVRKTDGLYAGLHGDLRDNFVIKALMSAAMHSRFSPAEQLALVEHYLTLFGPSKVLYMVGGNHDAWEKRVSGIDSLERLAAQNRILYDSAQFFVRIKAGVEYKLLIRHKGRFNSAYNPTHACMQAQRMGIADEPPDVVVMGHHHEPAITEWVWYGARRLAIKTGSAKLHDEWARQVGFAPGEHMAPVMIFWPDRRQMQAFWDHEEGAAYLKYLRRKR